MIRSLTDALLGAGLLSNANQVKNVQTDDSFSVFKMAISTLSELSSAWASNESGNMNKVNLKVNYNRLNSVVDISSHVFDTMVANTGAGFATQSHVIMLYDQIFKSVAPWSESKAFIMETFTALEFMPWIMNDLMIAVSQLSNTNLYGEVVQNTVRLARDILSADQLEEVKTKFQSQVGTNVAKNAAMVLEIRSRLEEKGVRVKNSVLLTAMTKVMGRNPFNMNSDQWSQSVVIKLAYTTARMSGVTTSASHIATGIKK